MTALFGSGAPVNFNGATWVTVVAAPATGKQREVLGLQVKNLDTADHTFSLRKNRNGTFHQLWPDRVIATGLTAQVLDAPIVLDADTDSLEMKIEGAHSVTAPAVDRAFFEVP